MTTPTPIPSNDPHFTRKNSLPRSDDDLVAQTFDLARTFSKIQGRDVGPDYRFDLSETQEDKSVWQMAIAAQEFLTGANMVKAMVRLPGPSDSVPIAFAPYCEGCRRRHEGSLCAYRKQRTR